MQFFGRAEEAVAGFLVILGRAELSEHYLGGALLAVISAHCSGNLPRRVKS